jgi:hypothetical protein
MVCTGHLPSHLSFYSNRSRNIHIRIYWCYTHIMMMLSVLWWLHQLRGDSVAWISAIGPSSNNDNTQQQNQQEYEPLVYWRLQPLTAWVLFCFKWTLLHMLILHFALHASIKLVNALWDQSQIYFLLLYFQCDSWIM